MTKPLLKLALYAVVCGTVALLSAPAFAADMLAQSTYAQRPLVLPKGTLRIDAAPSDFGYMDFGEINSGRGALRLLSFEGGEVLHSGVGASIGIVDNFEAGALLLPFTMHPNGNFGNLEAYARYRVVNGRFQMALQGAVQIPTDNQFGVGFGLPMMFHAGAHARLDFGAELELMTGPGRVHLDLPFAAAFDIGDSIFLGPRTGVRLPEMEDVQVPLGFFLGGTVGDVVDIVGSFTWWNFINTFGGDPVDLRTFELMLGASVFIDVF